MVKWQLFCDNLMSVRLKQLTKSYLNSIDDQFVLGYCFIGWQLIQETEHVGFVYYKGKYAYKHDANSF